MVLFSNKRTVESLAIRNALLLIEKIITKSLRFILQSKSHKDRISPTFFRSLANSLNQSYPGKVAFVVGHELSSTLSNRDKSTRVLIVGDSDHDVSESEYLAMKSNSNVVHFVQNLNFPESNNVFLLPIGIEDPKWAKSGMPWNLRPGPAHDHKIQQLLVGPFRDTDPSRRKLLELETNTYTYVAKKPMATFHYARFAAQFKFIACPRGNGMDTHRFWEALTRHSLPIVKDSAWARTLEKYVPLIILPDWDEESVRSIFGFQSKNWDFSKIDFLDPMWWRERIEKSIT